MEYTHNIHFLIPVEKYERLKDISKRLGVPRSEIVRQGVEKIITEYDGKTGSEGDARDESNHEE